MVSQTLYWVVSFVHVHLLALDGEHAGQHALGQASAEDDNIVFGSDLVHDCGGIEAGYSSDELVEQERRECSLCLWRSGQFTGGGAAVSAGRPSSVDSREVPCFM